MSISIPWPFSFVFDIQEQVHVSSLSFSMIHPASTARKLFSNPNFYPTFSCCRWLSESVDEDPQCVPSMNSVSSYAVSIIFKLFLFEKSKIFLVIYSPELVTRKTVVLAQMTPKCHYGSCSSKLMD